MKLLICTLAITLIGILLLAGCSDDPSDIGLGLLSSNDRIIIDSLHLQSDSTFTVISHITGNASTLLLGRHQNTSNAFDSKLMLDFGRFSVTNFPVIDSAKISFNINYRFKDSSETFGVSAHQIYGAWSQNSFTLDSLPLLSYDSAYSLLQMSEKTILSNDSVLTLRVDSLGWLRSDSSSFILIPSVTTNIILGFSNFYLRPQLTVSYHDSGDPVSKVYTTSPYRAIYVANGTAPPTSSDTVFVVQSAIAYRGQLKFSIPDSLKQKHASITQATLDIYLDSLTSLRNAYTNSSIEARLAIDSTSTPKLSTAKTSATPNSLTPNLYSFDVKNFMQLWTNGSPNYGIVFRATNEFIAFDRFSFYGKGTDTLHRPRLNIIYTILPTKRAAR